MKHSASHLNIVMFLVLGLILFSCNTFVDIELYRNTNSVPTSATLQAKANVRVEIADFFLKYLEDLLAFEGVDEFVELLQLEEFLQGQENITKVQIQSSSVANNSAVLVEIHTDNFINTLESLDLPYKAVDINNPQSQKVSLLITRNFLVLFLNRFAELEQMDIVSFFIPNEEVVQEAQFPNYIAWSFSDYEEEEKIVSILQESKIYFLLHKGNGGYRKVPDLGWNRPVTNNRTNSPMPYVQEKILSLVSSLYSNDNSISFYF